jgi:hypothetical protein
LVALVQALATMLGANVGTTRIVQLIAFNISAVAPVLFIVGVIALSAEQLDPGCRPDGDRADAFCGSCSASTRRLPPKKPLAVKIFPRRSWGDQVL